MAQQSAREEVLLRCLPASEGGLAHDIRARGNVPVQLGEACLFELTPHDIRESWNDARKLRRQVASAMVTELGLRLARSIHEDDGEPERLAGDAAACLFLALRHRDVPLKHALAGCHITWDGVRRSEEVECLT